MRWHLKQIEWAGAVRSGQIRVSGSRGVAHVLPSWNRRGMPDEELRDRAIGKAPTAIG